MKYSLLISLLLISSCKSARQDSNLEGVAPVSTTQVRIICFNDDMRLTKLKPAAVFAVGFEMAVSIVEEITAPTQPHNTRFAGIHINSSNIDANLANENLQIDKGSCFAFSSTPAFSNINPPNSHLVSLSIGNEVCRKNWTTLTSSQIGLAVEFREFFGINATQYTGSNPINRGQNQNLSELFPVIKAVYLADLEKMTLIASGSKEPAFTITDGNTIQEAMSKVRPDILQEQPRLEGCNY